MNIEQEISNTGVNSQSQNFGIQNSLFNIRYSVRVWVLIFLLAAKFANSQMLDSLSLDTMRGYTSLTAANEHPDKVIKLVIHHQKYTTIPEDIRKYTNLQYLDLSKNHVKVVPTWIGELKSLQTLILSKNNIDTLPDEIGDLVNLKYFIMNRTDLVSLPPEIGKLKELLYMDLWDDNLDDFPNDLGQLTKLKVLDLRDVAITDEVEAQLKSYLPHTIIFFSPTCQCKE